MKNKLAIRSQVVAPKDYYLLSADLSQAEAWVVAYLSNEATMKDVLKRGDIHSYTGFDVNDLKYPSDVVDKIAFSKTALKNGLITYNQRYVGKKSNHSFNYRQKGPGCATAINAEGIISVTNKMGNKFYDKYHALYYLKGWWTEIEEELSNNNKTMLTPYGRKRMFFSSWGQELFRQATSYIPQHCVAYHMYGKVQKDVGVEGGLIGVMKNIVKPSRGRIRLTNTAHDSCVLEVPKSSIKDVAEQLYRQLYRPMMIKGECFHIPVDLQYGERWGEGEDIKFA